LKDCPTKYYADKDTRACVACEHPCDTCNAPGTNGNCQSCVKDYGLKGGHCYNPCPDAFYNDKGVCKPCHASCKTCNGPTEKDCETCKDNTYLTSDHKCDPVCPNGSYEDDKTNTCEKCHSSCCDCSGPNAN